MLFLVIGENVTSGEPMPPKERMAYIQDSSLPTFRYLQEQEEKGRVLAGGAMVGRRGGAMIVDVDSLEELNELVSGIPVWGEAEWQLIPLMGFGSQHEHVQNMIERMSA